MNKLMITAACAIAAGVLGAQDMSPASTAIGQAGGGDSGAAMVGKAEQSASELNATPARSAEFKSAEDIVKERLRKAGITAGNGVVVGIGVSAITIQNPARESKFNTIRSAKATDAYMLAKAQIIRSIKMSVNAVDRNVTTEVVDDDPIMNEYNRQKDELDAKRMEIAEKLAELDEAESEALYSSSISGKFGNLIDALTKKLDKDFDSKKVPAEKRAVRDQLRKDCDALKKQFAALEKQAAKIKPIPTSDIESNTKMIAEMPLLGSTVVAQAESWDKTTGDYQMAMAVVWSPKLQEAALAISEGNTKLGKPGKFTPQQWIDMQNLEVMVGPRSFTDNKGNKIFVGIGVADFQVTGAKQKVRRMEAETEAIRNVAFSLGCDMAAYREMKKSYKEYSNDFGSTIGEKKNFSDVLSQQCNQQLNGCIELGSKVFVHPISKRKTYVVAYFINPELSREAMDLLKKAYAGAIRQDKANKYKQGVHDGAKQALKEQRLSTADYQRGVSDGNRGVKEEVRKSQQGSTSFGAAGSKQTGGGASQGGAFSGDSGIDTDF